MTNKIIRTYVDYTYSILEEDIAKLKTRYPFIETGVMGNSVLGKNLSYLRLGNGKNNVFFNGTHHSLEWITSVLLMKFVEDFCNAYENDEEIRDYNIKEIWDSSSIYIVPMVNPDGVDLVLNGVESARGEYYGKLVKWNNDSSDFSDIWQANIRGVDLNHNYNASWREYKLCQVKNNISGPCATRYSGKYPESEPESSAIANFTRYGDFNLVLALHSQGKEIYWDYNNLASDFAKEIGEKLAKVSGYELETPTVMASFTGFKDWFIQTFRKPGFTIEVGCGKNPLPITQFDEIYSDILELLLVASIITV